MLKVSLVAVCLCVLFTAKQSHADNDFDFIIKSGNLKGEISGMPLQAKTKKLIRVLKKAFGSKIRKIKDRLNQVESWIDKHNKNDYGKEHRQALAEFSRRLYELAVRLELESSNTAEAIKIYNKAFADYGRILTRFLQALDDLNNRLQAVENRNFGFAISLATSVDYSVDHDYALVVPALALTGYWVATNKVLWLSTGLGINPQDKTLAWNFSGSFEFVIAPRWSLGPTATATYDFGSEWKHGTRITISGGAKLRYIINDFALWVVPVAIGPYAQRLDSDPKPTFSITINSALGIDYNIL